MAAPGVRLKHKSLKSALYLVESPLRPLGSLMDCICGYQHKVKTYHLELDAEGTVIVSEEVFRRLAEIPGIIGSELTVTNAVKNPPARTIQLNGHQAGYRIVRKEV